MFGVVGWAAVREIVFVTRPPAPPAAQASIAAPSRTGGPAAVRTGFGKRIPQISTARSTAGAAGASRGGDAGGSPIASVIPPSPPRARTRARRSPSSRSQSRAATGRASAASGVLVDRGQPAIADDDPAGDDDVADDPRREPERPVRRQRVRGQRRRRRIVEDDEVGRGTRHDPAQERLVERLAGEAGPGGEPGERPGRIDRAGIGRVERALDPSSRRVPRGA